MKPAVLNETWATIVFWATVGATGVYDLVISVSHRVDRNDAPDHSQVPLTLAVAGGLIGGLIATRVSALDMPGPSWWPVALGLGVAIAGFALRIWAVRSLGRYFTKDLVVVRDQPVVESGPYRFVRHPSYTGLLAVFLGIGIMLGNYLALAICFGAPAIAFVWRIGVEERMLRRELGAPYEAYAAARKRLVPGFW